MAMRTENEQLEFEYIQLQYDLADALQETHDAPPFYDRMARARYGRVRSAGHAALRRLSGLIAQSGVRAAPAQ